MGPWDSTDLACCHAIEHFFDCKSYSTTNLFAIEITFYGIA